MFLEKQNIPRFDLDYTQLKYLLIILQTLNLTLTVACVIAKAYKKSTLF